MAVISSKIGFISELHAQLISTGIYIDLQMLVESKHPLYIHNHNQIIIKYDDDNVI